MACTRGGKGLKLGVSVGRGWGRKEGVCGVVGDAEGGEEKVESEVEGAG